MDCTTTICVIKPHIMKEGRAGLILADLGASGFKIITLGVYWL
jgi:nucleoside diphosphate kinase